MMRNKAMQRQIKQRDAIDISAAPREGPYYVLDRFEDGKDYCDAGREQWVWSIGRRKRDGKILASLQGDLYQNDDFECLWLR